MYGRTCAYRTKIRLKQLLSTSASTSKSTRSRIAIGGSKLSQNQQDGLYPSIIATSLQNSITTFESGLNGDEKLTRGYVDAAMFLKNVHNQEISSIGENQSEIVELTGRFGYRTSDESGKRIHGDIMQESSENGSTVFHNLSTSYVEEVLDKSPLVGLYQGKMNVDTTTITMEEEKILKEMKQNLNLTYMAHNPEAQGSEMHVQNAPLEDIRQYTKEKMTEAFIGLERGVVEGQITSYGVCSNGLGLPSSHPLHLSWEDMLQAASDAAKLVHSGSGIGEDGNVVANLSVVQLPINLLERHGLKVANRIKNYLSSTREERGDGESSSSLKTKLLLPSSIRVFAMRPLTCYPDRGTGTGHPFKLVDYLIPHNKDMTNDGSNNGKMWTHQIDTSSPQYYTTILNETMAHFDATPILETKEEEERELTTEERETIDGCKLLQSMIHDLDSNLSSGEIRSFAAYEEELYTKVVPLIHDTFEELDPDSAELLQNFFQAHGNAVRHSIARTTRKLLKEGGDGVLKYDIRDDLSLQEFALEYLWKQTCDGDHAKGSPLIDKVVIGCPKAEHVIEAVKIADKVD